MCYNKKSLLCTFKNGKYWSSLQNEPIDHDELLWKCNLHLAYMGKGIHAQLVLRTVTVQYEIFGIPDPYEIQEVNTKPLVLDSLTADENGTLNKLLDTGIQPNKIQKAVTVSAVRRVSSRADSVKDLSRVKRELDTKPAQQQPAPLKVEPLLIVRRL